MRHHKKRGAGGHSPDGPLYPDADASAFFGRARERTGRQKPDHKVHQLCKQVYRALSYALSDCNDEVVRDVSIGEVRPAPNASRLVVEVYPGLGSDTPAHEILARLDRCRGQLRFAVAAAIVRKRAPELAFHVIATGRVDEA